MKICGYCGKPNDSLLKTCEGCGTALPDEVHTPEPKPRSARVLCPACGASDDFKPAVELRSSFSLLAFLAGGILAVLFRNAGRGKKVQCNKCEALFQIGTPISKASLALFWLWVGPTIVILIILLIEIVWTMFSG